MYNHISAFVIRVYNRQVTRRQVNKSLGVPTQRSRSHSSLHERYCKLVQGTRKGKRLPLFSRKSKRKPHSCPSREIKKTVKNVSDNSKDAPGNVERGIGAITWAARYHWQMHENPTIKAYSAYCVALPWSWLVVTQLCISARSMLTRATLRRSFYSALSSIP